MKTLLAGAQIITIRILTEMARKPDSGVKFVVVRSACEDLAVPLWPA